MDELTDMINFLSISARLGLKSVGCQYILGLTGSEGGREVLLKRPVLVKCVMDLIRNPVIDVAKDAIQSIVNFSADDRGARMLLAEECCQKLGQDDTSNQRDDVVATCFSAVLDPECPIADPACMVLSNVTRLASNIERFMFLLERSEFSLDQIITAFTKRNYNKKGANFHYLGPLFSNLSQSIAVRMYLMDRERCVIQRLLPFTEFHPSVVRRGGIVGMLRNCSFDVENHSWLLSPEVDVLPHLLLPLAGPEKFPHDEVDNLPPELQYLPEDKTREPDPDIRKMLLETLLQLCALKESRELMRSRNVYLILRELHKWEYDRTVLLACENVMDILIRVTVYPGADRLPGEVLEKIFSYLPCEDLVESVQFVCSWWQQVSRVKGLWKHVTYKPRFGNVNVVEMLEKAPQLRILNLECATVDNDLIQFITDSCPNLEHLQIHWDSICKNSDVTITRPLSQIKILSLPWKPCSSSLDFPYLDSVFPNVESLNIAELRFKRKDLEQYLEKKWDSLHTLSLSCCTEDELCVLPCLSVCTKLRNLSLYYVCDKVQSWKEVGLLPNISRLVLYCSDMSNVNDSSPVFCSFPNITALVLSFCEVSGNVFCTIARNCPRLQKLKLSAYGTLYEDEELLIQDTLHEDLLIEDTLHALPLERLTHLCIHYSASVTDESIQHILRLMPQLMHLELYHCELMTPGSLKLICGISNLEVLKFDLRYWQLPADFGASNVKNKNLQLMFYNCRDVSYLDAMRQQHLRTCPARFRRCWMDRYLVLDTRRSPWIKHCCLWCS